MKARVKFLTTGEIREIAVEEVAVYERLGVPIKVLETYADLTSFMEQGLTAAQVMAEAEAACA